ncbi:MAG: ATP-binding protein [Candidatus Kapaibacterium sp.]
MEETQTTEKKSLKVVVGETCNWNELAKDCVCFANARGGVIYIGIENDAHLPPIGQKINNDLPDKIRVKISEHTVNVGVTAKILTATNGGQFIELTVLQSLSTIASTSKGKYYCRVSDECKPLLPDDLTRLLTDKPAFNWETKVVRNVRKSDVDPQKMQQFLHDIRASERVTQFIKDKTPDELLEYYLMSDGDNLTNLGVLWLGKRTDRAKLSYAPIVQFLKFDERANRVNKIVWDDYDLNPKELIEAIWTQIPDWKEGIEVADGIFRKFIPNYEEEIIREIIANALVHRPYTMRGDVFINLFPDRLEIHNPGLLPLGITPQNILHKTIRRNDHLAKVFYDLKLMEREGSGYDKIYQILLSAGKQVPTIEDGDDRVIVTIRKQISKIEVISLVSRAITMFQLNQKEIISLGLIAQFTTLTAIEFSKVLDLKQANSIRDWLGKLIDLGIVKSKGKTKGVEYYISTEFLRTTSFKGVTNLKKIEDYRLSELIFQDLKTYPNSTFHEIHNRIGKEIKTEKIRKQLNKLILNNKIETAGGKKFRTYSLI